MITIFLLYTRL